MRILSIDSSLGTQVAVVDAGPHGLEVLTRIEQDDPRRHAESLGPLLAQALAAPEAGALDAVVAATGPAPFTGLRAGLVAARALGRARGIPVHGVPSLDAVARCALDVLEAPEAPEVPADLAGTRSDAQAGPVILVTTDARRREVYAARYRARGADDVIRLDDLAVVAPDRARDLGAAQAVAGSGAVLYPELGEGLPTVAPVSGDAVAQVRIALARLERGEELDGRPLYLRHADVQMPQARKRVT
ncbi:tRNA (adenosine(37)-N6)-threonylcarbamoyltransferase complex dimerization subunit type 1 TsaB [Actinomyces slackii]|uniref:Universal bacterial protein YeaZ n=1 Tax=Actinomyces slackii TaxID=52774 RepID=A0A448KBZ4_9ACTO|nr:tRNA (adenosine(37)-N6)-threonylcarbamoyltransferase complex dimerization subunit type 1 TsaB [Actinomyces slackii]VEG74455.1 universal bacterial protein YeaZ [Actinomyces slackii]